MRIPNTPLTIPERIKTISEIDVIVAKSYNLTKLEYQGMLESFKLFKDNPALYNQDTITWNNQNIKGFYGEMRKKALELFEKIQ